MWCLQIRPPCLIPLKDSVKFHICDAKDTGENGLLEISDRKKMMRREGEKMEIVTVEKF